MKRAYLLLALPVLLLSCGPDKNKKNNGKAEPPAAEKTRFIAAGSQLLFPVMKLWAAEYNKTAPGVIFDLRSSSSGEGMASLKAGTADIAMSSRPLTPAEISDGYFEVAVLLDIVLPVICFDNPEIQDVVMFGLKKGNLAATFSGKNKSWGGLDRSRSVTPVTVYYRADSSGTTQVWGDFLGLDAASMTGNAVSGETAMFSAIASDPRGLGYASAYTLYNITTGIRKQGIYIVPVDFNDNGHSDDSELVYDKFSTLKKALQENKLPSPPARKLYLVTKGKPSAPLKAFINWVLSVGQNFADKSGYIILSREQAASAIQSLGTESTPKP